MYLTSLLRREDGGDFHYALEIWLLQKHGGSAAHTYKLRVINVKTREGARLLQVPATSTV